MALNDVSPQRNTTSAAEGIAFGSTAVRIDGRLSPDLFLRKLLSPGDTAHHSRMSRRCFNTFSITPNAIAVLLVGMLPTGLALAADPTALDRGRSLAVAHCAICHAVERDDASPTRINVETSFRDLYKRFPIDMITDAIKTGILEGHDEMPAFQFTYSELTDLLSFIDSLSPPGAPRYTR